MLYAVSRWMDENGGTKDDRIAYVGELTDSDKNWEVGQIGQKGQYFKIFTRPSDTLLALQAPKV